VTDVFAHRGCTEGFTENTVDAFAEARRRGADGVELDVRLTADGALAVHHDAEIPGVGTIAQLEVGDLPAHVPLLPDVLAVCDGMMVNVEIKNAPQDPGWDPGEAVAALTAAAIEEAGWTTRVFVSSFQVATLRAVQAADRRLDLGALWGFGTEAEAALAEAVEAGFAAVHPFVGPTQWALRSMSGRSTPQMTCAPWCPWGWTRSSPTGWARRWWPQRRAASEAFRGGTGAGRPERPLSAPNRACRRAEWRGTTRFHKDGPP
jgi:glycerophosphoryl diester phosphodiesterase